MAKGKPANRQVTFPSSAPDFARSTGFPKSRQTGGTAAGRAPNGGQTKHPGNQGGRSEADPKS